MTSRDTRRTTRSNPSPWKTHVRPPDWTTPQGSLQQALDAAAHPQYLGDPAVVKQLIGDFVNFVVNDGDTAQKSMAQIAKLEWIFAGDDPAYGPVPHWNLQGGLLAHLQQTLKVPDPDLRSALHTTFLILLRELYTVMRNHNDDGDTDKARYHLRVHTEEWVNHLMGIATSRPYLYQQQADEPEPEEQEPGDEG